jgi:hypothetical protein
MSERRRLFPAIPALGALLGASALFGIPTMRMSRKRPKFWPCRGCGNPARLGYCFKCETKDREKHASQIQASQTQSAGG